MSDIENTAAQPPEQERFIVAGKAFVAATMARPGMITQVLGKAIVALGGEMTLTQAEDDGVSYDVEPELIDNDGPGERIVFRSKVRP